MLFRALHNNITRFAKDITFREALQNKCENHYTLESCDSTLAKKARNFEERRRRERFELEDAYYAAKFALETEFVDGIDTDFIAERKELQVERDLEAKARKQERQEEKRLEAQRKLEEKEKVKQLNLEKKQLEKDMRISRKRKKSGLLETNGSNSPKGEDHTVEPSEITQVKKKRKEETDLEVSDKSLDKPSKKKKKKKKQKRNEEDENSETQCEDNIEQDKTGMETSEPTTESADHLFDISKAKKKKKKKKKKDRDKIESNPSLDEHIDERTKMDATCRVENGDDEDDTAPKKKKKKRKKSKDAFVEDDDPGLNTSKVSDEVNGTQNQKSEKGFIEEDVDKKSEMKKKKKKKSKDLSDQQRLEISMEDEMKTVKKKKKKKKCKEILIDQVSKDPKLIKETNAKTEKAQEKTLKLFSNETESTTEKADELNSIVKKKKKFKDLEV